jgi:hypothetical protein
VRQKPAGSGLGILDALKGQKILGEEPDVKAGNCEYHGAMVLCFALWRTG